MTMSDDLFLFQRLDTLRDLGFAVDLPSHIKDNLNDRIVLRQYQEDAFSNFLSYLDNPNLSKNKQTHLLFHMATGAGKTVMMAGLILHYYQLGYRNFLFFVNQTNIIEKTKANFLDSASSKYLFASVMEFEGRRVHVREVENFASSDPDAINLCFTTTQKLHSDFTMPREGALSREDFEDTPVVMLSDESHHVNSRTKKATRDEEADDRSWEYTVANLFVGNRENVLLEFTATLDLRDKNVELKYRDKIVFDYPLAKFRDSRFTKDFVNLQTTLGLWHRTLQALLISEYRRSIFAEAGISAKPVVLLKSQRIEDSRLFYAEFFRRLPHLTPEEFAFLDGSGLSGEALEYFRSKDESLLSLCRSLRLSFAETNTIIINGATDNSKEKQLAVNSLEDPANQYRLVFTVDMLNEGWDVLNLFDIVRLYDTRQGGKKGKPGAYTIKEAQLIGRGARYFPFLPNDEIDSRDLSEKFIRKYDNDVTNPRRILETLVYHSQQDSQYISELRQALQETGLCSAEAQELTYSLKPEFRSSDFFRSAYVFSNKREEVSRSEVREIDHRVRSRVFNISVRQSSSRLLNLFDEENTDRGTNVLQHKSIQLKEIPLNVVLGTLDFFESLRFDSLKRYFPNLDSVFTFINADEYLGSITIAFETDHLPLSAADYIVGLRKVFEEIAEYLSKITVTYRGTEKFEPKPLLTVLRDKTIHVTEISPDGKGTSQTDSSNPNIRVNLLEADWYAQNDNYGTSEEKAFVHFFAGIESQLRTEYGEVYLVRNERFPELAIYSFDTGERFEPDFLLFLRRKGTSVFEQEQIYIEPKGDQLLDTDKWKEDFLLQLQKRAIPHTVHVDTTKYRIIGLPFFNQANRMQEFREAISEF